MRNIPMFTAQDGLASLILREIPYSGRAYVLVRSLWNDNAAGLLAECRGFCRAAGAEQVFASWEDQALPAQHAYDMLRLTCRREALPMPECPVELWPVTEENADSYLAIYNHCFRQVPGAAAYDRREMERLCHDGTGWLARQGDAWAGVVELGDNTLEGIAVRSEYRGLGHALALTALRRLPGPEVSLKVADTNTRAMALYRRLGFTEDRLISRWWLVE